MNITLQETTADDPRVQALMAEALREAIDEHEPNGGALTEVLNAYNTMKAEGRNVVLRLEAETMTISVVELEEVSVDLGEIAAEALREVDEEMAAEAASGVTPVYLDEPEDA